MPRHGTVRLESRYHRVVTDDHLKSIEYLIKRGGPLVYPLLSYVKDQKRLVAVRFQCRWLAFVVTPGNRVVTTLPEHKLKHHRYLLEERKQQLIAWDMEEKGQSKIVNRQAREAYLQMLRDRAKSNATTKHAASEPRSDLL